MTGSLKMDLEEITFLLSKNEELERENGHLRSLLGLNEAKTAQKARSFSGEACEELSGRTPWSFGEKTCDEKNFRKNLQLSSVKSEHRTSSPVDFKSFLLSSMHTDTSEKAESQRCQADYSPNVKDEKRLLGEVAFQLDRRILTYVFQRQRRYHGFTLINIPDKIREVSTHLITGKIDEGYRLYLTQRYTELMERLGQLGYKAPLHHFFTEFIVNTFGILKERPDVHSMYNNADFLKKAILTIAPGKLQKDLLIVHSCLCEMAQKDGSLPLLW